MGDLLKDPAIQNLIVTILGAIGTYIALVVKKKWNELKSQEIEKINNETLKSLAKQAVDYVELKFKDYASVDKLDQAFKLIQEELGNKGIIISDLAVNLAIESAVKALKDAGIEVHSNITVGEVAGNTLSDVGFLGVGEPLEVLEVPKRIVIKNNNNNNNI